MITFPDSLPDPLLSGYGYQQADNVIRTEMATGRKRRRPRSPNAPTYLNASWRLSNEQMALLEGFFKHVAVDGSNEFLMYVRTPLGTSLHTVAFDSPLNPSPVSAQKWQVSARIEIKNRAVLSDQETADQLLTPNTSDEFIEGVTDAVESY